MENTQNNNCIQRSTNDSMKSSRMTKQRALIFRELKKVCTHPTADEIFTMVKKYMPHISLGTVYRNLEFLVDSGAILKIDSAGTVRRFDGNTEPHSHARCTCCGKVIDVFQASPHNILPLPMEIQDFVITQTHIEYEGLCSSCRQTLT